MTDPISDFVAANFTCLIPSEISQAVWDNPPSPRTVECPRCHVVSGERCKTSTGNPTAFHQIRRQTVSFRSSSKIRDDWEQRALKGEVDSCQCFPCRRDREFKAVFNADLKLGPNIQIAGD